MMPTSPLEVTCQAVKDSLNAGEDLLLLDCREREEFDIVRIEQGVLVPMSEIASRLAELNPHRDRRVVVYCHLGGRSLQVADWLRRQGFLRAQSLEGGIDRWAVEIEPDIGRY